jgi:hypothetical protein
MYLPRKYGIEYNLYSSTTRLTTCPPVLQEPFLHPNGPFSQFLLVVVARVKSNSGNEQCPNRQRTDRSINVISASNDLKFDRLVPTGG